MPYHYLTAWHQPNPNRVFSRHKPLLISPNNLGLAYELLIKRLPGWLTGYVGLHNPVTRDIGYLPRDWVA